MNMLSVVIITKNEENNIVDCIQSVTFASEIIVVDDNSDDATVDLARKHGAQVVSYIGDDDFSKKRNVGLQKTKGKWVLFIDADERVSSALKEEIQRVITQDRYDGFFLRRQDHLWGKALHYGETAQVLLLRLAKKTAGEWHGTVHETWKVTGKTSILTRTLDHYPHQTLTEFLREINHYTDLRAEELFSQKVPVYWWDMLVYPNAKFILNYGIRLGFLDGVPGLILAILMSFHSFLVRSKLWWLWQKK